MARQATLQQTNETDAEANAKQDGEIEVVIGDESILINEQTARSLKTKLSNAIESLQRTGNHNPDPFLHLVSTNHGYSNGVWHINGKHGCDMTRKDSSHYTKQLNLVELLEEPIFKRTPRDFDRTGYWKQVGRDEERDEPMDFETYFDNFVCQFCQPTLEFWHHQRQIYLTALADNTRLDWVTTESFEEHEREIGSCEVCGTPKSGIATLETIDAPHDIESPITMCPTCRDLLLEADAELRIEKKSVESHPHATTGYYPGKPVTDPDKPLRNEDSLRDNAIKTLSEMSNDEFDSVVSRFEHGSSHLAGLLVEAGYETVIDVANATPEELQKKAPGIGEKYSHCLVQQAEQYREAFIEANIQSDELPAIERFSPDTRCDW